MRAGGLVAKVRYGVFQFDNDWLLFCEQHRLARYSYRAAAVGAGMRAACQAMGSGFDAELLVMDAGGQLQAMDPTSFAP